MPLGGVSAPRTSGGVEGEVKRTANGFLYSAEEQARILYAEALMAAWCDDFERAMTWLCAPEPTVTIPLKEYERLKAGFGVGQLEQQMRGQWPHGALGQLGQLGQLIPKVDK